MRVWAKQERVETLLDPDDVAAGSRTRMRWRGGETWIRPATPRHPALVAGRLATGEPGRSRPRPSAHPYVLRGLLSCARCGAKLQGAWRPGKGDGHERIPYRCEIRRRALPPEFADHPPTPM